MNSGITKSWEVLIAGRDQACRISKGRTGEMYGNIFEVKDTQPEFWKKKDQIISVGG